MVSGAAIVAVALLLRLWNLQFGLPEWYHPDEPLKARAIARIAAGDLHPGSFYHPSFMLYAAALVLRAQHLGGVEIVEQTAVRAGRLTVALLGTATVALTLIAGAWAYDPSVGVIAAALLAVAPLHVVCSHYLNKPPPNADRYVVPILPFLAITAATALFAAGRLVRDRLVLAGIVAAVLCGPLIVSTRLLWTMQPDTRAAAATWLREHARGSARIVLEGALNTGAAIVPAYVPALPSGCAATYVYSLERERDALGHADVAVASSFMYDRFLRFLPPGADARHFYEEFFATHQLLAEFTAPYQSYGFHNPTIRVYAVRK